MKHLLYQERIMAVQRPHADDPPEFHEPSYEKGMEILDAEARRTLGISGEEFLRRHDAGEYRGIEEDEIGRAVVNLWFLIPVARPTRVDDAGRFLPAD